MSPSIAFNSFTPSGASRQRHRRRHRRLDFVQRPEPLPVLFGADSARDPPSDKQHSSLSRPHEGCSRSRHFFHRKCQRDVISGGLFGSAAAPAPRIPLRVTGGRSDASLALILRLGTSKATSFSGLLHKRLRHCESLRRWKCTELSMA
ncbi:uncharacterized protein LOC142570761 [Dermacentor variabilis]|uniref:uncharacterized protein LOC142570761 n=1 Tax=Dermacentor variabilis TaxID=34621 RepID=UPI003F5BA326